jgi:hypothetical protein
LKNIRTLSEPEEYEQIFLNTGNFKFSPAIILMKRSSERHIIVPVLHLLDNYLEILLKIAKLCQPHYIMNKDCLEELKKMGKAFKNQSKGESLGNKILNHVNELGKLKQESELVKMKKRQLFKMCKMIFNEITKSLKDSALEENFTSSIINCAEIFFLKNSVVNDLETDFSGK